jgi:hypothetical protein
MLYSIDAPVGAVIVIVPVGVVQVGCAVTNAVGAAGAPGTVLTVTLVAVDVQPVEVFCAVTLYVPGATPVNVPLDWYVIPSMLYSMEAPVGAVTVIVPVGVVQVGCAVTKAVGAAGAPGTVLTVTLVAVETQPVDVFCAITLYVPGATPVKVPLDWYVTPSMLYSIDAPVGDVIAIVPVGVEQVGCAVTETVGAAGAEGTAFTVTLVAVDVQPVEVFCAVTL